ncbi:MAG TPA: hypothetical protein VIP98_21925 [Microlunatus sp.]
MSEYVAEIAPVHTGASVSVRGDSGLAARKAGPVAWFATMLGFVLSPPRAGERGMVTVEFIFGVLIAIAIVTIVVSALGQKELAGFFMNVLKKLVSLIFKGI